MKGLHHLPQDCTFRRRGAKTKLSKLQQIDAINVKKRSRCDSCAQPMNPKGEKIGNMWFGGHKESPAELSEVGLNFDTWLRVLNSTS